MTQALFAAALRDPAHALPSGLRAWNGSDPGVRLDVHRNTFVASLVAALGETLPVARQAVGAEFFDALARAFVAVHPPATPVLAEWGDDFAPWVAQFAPAAALPWLADLARLERARVVAFHAADAEPLAPALLAARLADAAALPGLRLRLHPSCALVRSCWAVVSLWAAHHDADADPADIDLDHAEAALVLRDDGADGAVLVLPLPAPQAAFCEAVLAGRPLGEAMALAPAAGTDLAPLLAQLLRHGALVGIESGAATNHLNNDDGEA